MPRGGARPNAGRPKGAATRKTQELIQQAAAAIGPGPDGEPSMLEIMVAGARHFHAEAVAAERKLADVGAITAAMEDEGERLNILIAQAKNAAGLREKAVKCAAVAANFHHPRIKPIDPNAKADDHVPLAERLKAYARRDAIDASGGTVVELKKGQAS